MKRARKEISSQNVDQDSGPSSKRKPENVWSIQEVLGPIVDVEPRYCRNVCRLIDEGCSIPFIARYRREMTGNMGPDQLRHFQEQYDSFKEVKEKAEKLIKKVTELNQLTPSLKSAILHSISTDEIELLAAPFKATGGNQTLAARARNAGLEPMAISILKGEGSPSQLYRLINPKEETVATLDKVTEGVSHILADEIVHSKEAVDQINDMVNCGKITLESKQKKSKTSSKEDSERSVFKNYFDFSVPVRAVKPHQVLAINRGEKKKELSVRIILPEYFSSNFEQFFVRFFRLDRSEPARQKMIRSAVQDGFKRLVSPMITRRVRGNLNRAAEKAALDVFSENLRNLLLTPPCKGSTILGIDPGYKNGCKMALISPQAEVLDSGVIFPTFQNSKSSSGRDKSTVLSLASKHGLDLISIGNGHGCRDVEKWVASILSELPKHVQYTIVTEDGASIYSCSPEGLAENPGLEPTIIGAVSIARRLQDPLSEFVKIGPKHIGVGMYQHDLSEQKLKKALKEVLLECVSFVGLDLNTAPIHLLRHVSGITETLAKNILQFREKNGEFVSRLQLKKVKGIGEKVFEQCAGFVRIEQNSAPHKKAPVEKKKSAKAEVFSYNPLDSTLVHPESYELARKIIQLERFDVDQIGSPQFIEHFRQISPSKFDKKFEDKNLTERIPQIIEAFQLKLSPDIRDEKCRPTFRRDILTVENLHTGLVVTGVVRNVTHFGAFVDIGVGTDGLVHVSKMNGLTLMLGQKVEVKVLDLDRSRARFGLGLEKIVNN